MYCQTCGKEIDECVQKCPHCENVIYNTYIPVEDGETEEEEEERQPFTIKAVKPEKPEKKMKRPSLVPLRVTSIVMYGVLFAYYFSSSINDFVNGHQYSFKSVMDVVFAVMFLTMLIFSSLGKISKRLSLIPLATYCIFEIVYNIIVTANNINYLSGISSLAGNMFLLASLFLRICTIISMTVVLVFAFVFYLRKIASPLPMCISSGIFLVFEILALIFNALIMILGITEPDVFVLLSLFAVYTYFGITISQVFLFHKQDKYQQWLKRNTL